MLFFLPKETKREWTMSHRWQSDCRKSFEATTNNCFAYSQNTCIFLVRDNLSQWSYYGKHFVFFTPDFCTLCLHCLVTQFDILFLFFKLMYFFWQIKQWISHCSFSCTHNLAVLVLCRWLRQEGETQNITFTRWFNNGLIKLPSNT